MRVEKVGRIKKRDVATGYFARSESSEAISKDETATLISFARGGMDLVMGNE